MTECPTGKPCERCKAGWYHCYTSRPIDGGRHRAQYYCCYLCGAKPEASKLIVPNEPKRVRTTA